MAPRAVYRRVALSAAVPEQGGAMSYRDPVEDYERTPEEEAESLRLFVKILALCCVLEGGMIALLSYAISRLLS